MTLIATCLTIIIAFAIDFFIYTALTWGICICLPPIGITTLFGWAIQFSWQLAFVVWAFKLLICKVLSSIRGS